MAEPTGEPVQMHGRLEGSDTQAKGGLTIMKKKVADHTFKVLSRFDC